MRQNVLFISHEATRTGAPLFLLNLIKWLKENDAVSFAILLNGEGEMEHEFEKLGETFHFRYPTRPPRHYYFSRMVKALFLEPIYKPLYLRMLKRKIKKREFTLIYSNTVTNGDVLEFLNDLNCRVITHIHELQYIIDAFGEANIEKVLKYTDSYIAASESVRANYMAKYRVQPARIVQINDFIINAAKHGEAVRERVFRDLGVPESAFIVGLAGTVEWRKGPDLLIQLALRIKKSNPDMPIYFFWVGAFTDSIEKTQRSYDLDRTGTQDKIFFLGVKENAGDYYSLFDVFVLLSREEAFGIVGIECAYMGKPVLCFAKAGGMPAFVEADAGFIVPYLDIEEMANKIVMLYERPDLAKKFGKRGREKVLANYTIEKTGPVFLETINKTGLM